MASTCYYWTAPDTIQAKMSGKKTENKQKINKKVNTERPNDYYNIHLSILRFWWKTYYSTEYVFESNQMGESRTEDNFHDFRKWSSKQQELNRKQTQRTTDQNNINKWKLNDGERWLAEMVQVVTGRTIGDLYFIRTQRSTFNNLCCCCNHIRDTTRRWEEKIPKNHVKFKVSCTKAKPNQAKPLMK